MRNIDIILSIEFREELIKHIIESSCPNKFGLDKLNPCPDTGHSYHNCIICWNIESNKNSGD